MIHVLLAKIPPPPFPPVHCRHHKFTEADSTNEGSLVGFQTLPYKIITIFDGSPSSPWYTPFLYGKLRVYHKPHVFKSMSSYQFRWSDGLKPRSIHMARDDWSFTRNSLPPSTQVGDISYWSIGGAQSPWKLATTKAFILQDLPSEWKYVDYLSWAIPASPGTENFRVKTSNVMHRLPLPVTWV